MISNDELGSPPNKDRIGHNGWMPVELGKENDQEIHLPHSGNDVGWGGSGTGRVNPRRSS
jgi:hypothetical protein